MAALAIAALGAVGGSAVITGTVLGMTGAQIGWMAGTIIGSMMFPPKSPDGPRLNDRQVQTSTYGQAIPRGYGAFRIAGNVIWSEDLIETAQRHKTGGFLGIGGSSYTTYSYSANFAVSVCEGPITAVRKIWADGKLIFNIDPANTGPQADPEVFGETATILPSSAQDAGVQAGYVANGMTIYLGTETQEPDPNIVAAMGDSPAYRGQAYIVFMGMQLEKFGNRIPNMTFEVIVEGTKSENPAEIIGYSPNPTADDVHFYDEKQERDPVTGYIWAASSATGVIQIFDPISRQTIKTINYAPVGGYYLMYVTYCPFDRTMWCSTAQVFNNRIVRIRCDSYTVIDEFDSGSYRPICYNPVRNEMITNSAYALADDPVIWNVADLSYWQLPNPTGDFPSYCEVANNQILYYLGFTNGSYALYNAATMSLLKKRSNLGGGLALSFQLLQNFCYDSKRERWIIIGSIEVSGDWRPYFYNVSTDTWTAGEAPPAASTAVSFKNIRYHAPTDTYVVGEGPVVTGNGFLVYSAEDFSFIRMIKQANGYKVGHMLEDTVSLDRYYSASSNGSFVKWPLTDSYTSDGQSLATVVTDECALAGLTASDIDVTLLTDTVDGYFVNRQASIRSSLEQLMMGFQFDAVESSGKLKFVPRGGASVATLTIDDLAAHQFGQDVPTPLPIARMDEVDLPSVVNIQYSNADADYQVSSQIAKRITTSSVAEVSTQLPIVMSDSRAKAVADASLYSNWAARMTVTFSTSFAYSELEPTDIVVIEGNTIRITEKKLDGNIIHFGGAFDSGSIYLQGSIAGETPPSTQSQILLPAKPRLILLDSVLYRDEDDVSAISFYSMTTPYADVNWRGASAFRSTDGGTVYNLYTEYNSPVVTGFAQDALATYLDNLVDEYNTVTVFMTQGTLSSITYDELLAGKNLCFLGDEILQFRVATLIGTNTYRLSSLLRGRRGTSTTGHVAGENFIIPDDTTISRPNWTVAELDIEYLYKAGSPGSALSDVVAVPFTNTGKGAMPLSPVQLAAARNASNDITFKWVRRTRVGGVWADFIDAPLGEATEEYEVVIYSNSTYTTETRVITATSQTASYTAAQQVTDFGSAQSTVYVRVFQISATVDRGFPAQGAL